MGHNDFCVGEQGGVHMALAAEWCLPPVLNVLIHRRGEAPGSLAAPAPGKPGKPREAWEAREAREAREVRPWLLGYPSLSLARL